MNTNFAFTRSYTENLIWYQQLEARQFRKLRGGQAIVHFDVADNCRLNVTTMKAEEFQDDIPSIPIDNLKIHYALMFDLTSRQDATENRFYPEPVGGRPRLKLNFTLPPEHVTQLFVFRVTNVLGCLLTGVVGKNIKTEKHSDS